MAEISKLSVGIEVDASNFQAGLGKISSSLSGLGTKLSTIGSSISSGFSSSLTATQSKLSSFVSGLKRDITGLSDEMKTIGGGLSGFLTLPLLAAGAGAVKVAGDMQGLRKGLEAVLPAGADLNEELAKLKELAKLPGLGLEEAIQGSINLQAAGFSAELARKALQGFGNALATVGKGKAELDGVSTALTQMAAKGKISAEEINQIAERVPQIRKVMQEAFGTSNSEDLQKLGISATEFVEKVSAELNKLPAVTGGIKNSWENMFDGIKAGADKFGTAINEAFDLEGIFNSIGNAVEGIAESFANLSPTTQKIILVFAGVAAAIGPLLLGLGSIGAMLPVLTAGFTLLTGPIGIALAALLGIGAAFAIFSSSSDEATKSAQKQGETVKGLEKNLNPLLARYDQLKAKSSLSKEEQTELNEIIKKIGTEVPTAITAFDSYGNALDINSDKAKEFVKQQQAILAIKNKEAIAEQTNALNELQVQIVKVQTTLAKGTVTQNIGMGMTQELKLSGEEIAKLQAKLADLQNQKLGTQGLINELNGIPVAAKAAGDAIAEAAVKPQPLLAKLNAQLKEQQSILNSATDEKTIQSANVKIAAIEKEIKRLEELGIANSKVSEILKAHNEEMRKATELSILWGDGYDIIGEKAETLNSTIEKLISEGLSAQSVAVQKLKTELDSLGVNQQFEFSGIAKLETNDDQFAVMKAGADALVDTFNARLTPSLQNVAAGIAAMQVPAQDSAVIFGNAMTESAEYASQFGGVIGSMNGLLAGFGDALINTALTGANFGQQILKSISEFAASFGKQVVAIGIAKLGLDKLFATPGGAAIAIAGGIALIAVAKALGASASANLSSATSGGSSGGSSASPRSTTTPNTISGAPVKVEGTTTVKGRDLVIVFDSEKSKQKRTT